MTAILTGERTLAYYRGYLAFFRKNGGTNRNPYPKETRERLEFVNGFWDAAEFLPK